MLDSEGAANWSAGTTASAINRRASEGHALREAARPTPIDPRQPRPAPAPARDPPPTTDQPA
eukprot:9750129-Alexandrium_andersonii.AAC.1